MTWTWYTGQWHLEQERAREREGRSQAGCVQRRSHIHLNGKQYCSGVRSPRSLSFSGNLECECHLLMHWFHEPWLVLRGQGFLWGKSLPCFQAHKPRLALNGSTSVNQHSVYQQSTVRVWFMVVKFAKAKGNNFLESSMPSTTGPGWKSVFGGISLSGLAHALLLERAWLHGDFQRQQPVSAPSPPGSSDLRGQVHLGGITGSFIALGFSTPGDRIFRNDKERFCTILLNWLFPLLETW